MHKSLFLSLFLLLCLVIGGSFYAIPVHAKSIVPSGTFAATSDVQFGGGSVHGYSTSFVIDAPTISNSDGIYQKFIEMEVISGGNYALANVGEEVDSTSTGGTAYCAWEGTGKYLFAYARGYDGTVWVDDCYPIDSHDYNSSGHIQVGYYTSNGGGVFFQMQFVNTYVGSCYNGCFSPGGKMPQTYSNSFFKVVIRDTFTGHKVWGQDDSNFKYQSTTDGNWYYITVPGTVTASNPPQMYWNVLPSSGGYGGDLWSCVYDSGTVCTIGS